MNKTIRLSKNTCYTILVFLAVYCSHDTLLFGTNVDNRFLLIRKAIPFLLLICLILLKPSFRIRKTDLFICLVLLLMPVISCLVNGEDMNNYIYRAAVMGAALLFLLTGEKNAFITVYNKILYFLSIWSIGTYLLMLLLPQVIQLFPTVMNSAGTPYFFTGFSVMNSQLHYGMVRNSSIFREPGVFCVMLTVAMINEMVVLKSLRGKYILVYTAAMITTYSTAGYIILIGLYAYYLLIEKNVKHKGRYIFLGLVALVVIATQTDLLSRDGAIFDKFVKGSNSYGSWLARLRSVTQSIVITLENPMFGIGRYALYDTVLGMTGVYRTVDNTNTILVGFAAYGILFGILLSWGCWRFVRQNCWGILAAVTLFAVLMMAFSNEDLGQNVLFYYIVFDGLCRVGGTPEAILEKNGEATKK
jgi:hypothetical protein